MSKNQIRDAIAELGKDLHFDPEPHIYTYKGEEMVSGTTFLKPYFPFDREAAADAALAGRNPKYADCETREDVWDIWMQKADHGTAVHEFCEDYLNGEFVSIEHPQMQAAFKYWQAMKFEDVLNEVQIVAPEWGISGMVDCLIKIDGRWWIYDHKTDKQVDTENSNRYWDKKKGRDVDESSYYCPGVLYGFDNCNFNKYTFQLGLYRFILEHVYEIPIAGCMVVHYDEKKNKAVEYPLPYYPDYIAMLINAHLNNK